MTYLNPDNQTHLVRYKERALIDRLVQCIRLCASRLPRHPPPSVSWSDLLHKESEAASSQAPPTSSTEAGAAEAVVEFQRDQHTLLTCLLAIFRLFVNVSHSGQCSPSNLKKAQKIAFFNKKNLLVCFVLEYASDRLGGCPDLLEATLDCLFHLPDRLPSSRRFDLLILILCLLANLCEHCPENRIRIVHLEVRSAESGSASTPGGGGGISLTDVGYEDDEAAGENGGSPQYAVPPRVPTISALDEVVKLFLYREKKSLMHEFEREDDADAPTHEEEEEEEGEGRKRGRREADSTTPKSPPSLLAAPSETIEEAGLKWRLIGGNKHSSGAGAASSSSAGGGGGAARLSSECRRLSN